MATTAALKENSRQGINFQIKPSIGSEDCLRPNLRPGCGRAYDETPVGLVVYVRNDPVNLIDPDGRNAAPLEYSGSWRTTRFSYSMFVEVFFPYFYDFESGGLVGIFQPTTIDVSVTMTKWIPETFDGAGQNYNYETLLTNAIDRADNAVSKNKDCAAFLQRTINNLNLDMTPNDLINRLKSLREDGNIHNDAPKSPAGAVVYYRSGVININKNGYTTYLYASLIHETFHDYKGIDNDKLEAAMRKADSGWGPMQQIQKPITGIVARNCGEL